LDLFSCTRALLVRFKLRRGVRELYSFILFTVAPDRALQMYCMFLKCHLAQWHPNKGLGLRRTQAACCGLTRP